MTGTDRSIIQHEWTCNRSELESRRYRCQGTCVTSGRRGPIDRRPLEHRLGDGVVFDVKFDHVCGTEDRGALAIRSRNSRGRSSTYRTEVPFSMRRPPASRRKFFRCSARPSARWNEGRGLPECYSIFLCLCSISLFFDILKMWFICRRVVLPENEKRSEQIGKKGN